MEKANSYIALLQKYEKAPATHEVVYQNKEDPFFWSLWGLSSAPEPRYRVNPQWDYWFEDAKKAEETRPKERPAVYTMGRCLETNEREEEDLKKLREMKPRLYTYPNVEEFTTVFEFEDLAEESVVCLCIKSAKKQYIWRGIDFKGSEEEVKKYAEEVKENCWQGEGEVIQNFQTQESPSPSFLEYFD